MSLHRVLLHGRFCGTLATVSRSISGCPTTATAAIQHLHRPGSHAKCQTGLVQNKWPYSSHLFSLDVKNGGILCTVMPKRYLRKWEITRIPPTKKLNFDFAGDETDKLPPVYDHEIKPGFEGLEELIEEGGEDLKRIFSMEYATSKEKLEKRMSKVLEQIKDHPADIKSVEYKIALRTVLIRTLMKDHHEFRKNKKNKTRLYNLIQSRRKMMKYLRIVDLEKFEWLSRELKYKFVHIPEPDENRKLSKREVREQAARDAAETLRAEKFEIFRKKLAEQRREFEDHKATELDNILKEMESLGLEYGDSLDQALVALGDQPYTHPKTISKRRQALQDKFIKYADGGPRQQRKSQRAAAAAAAGKK